MSSNPSSPPFIKHPFTPQSYNNNEVLPTSEIVGAKQKRYQKADSDTEEIQKIIKTKKRRLDNDSSTKEEHYTFEVTKNILGINRNGKIQINCDNALALAEYRFQKEQYDTAQKISVKFREKSCEKCQFSLKKIEANSIFEKKFSYLSDHIDIKNFKEAQVEATQALKIAKDNDQKAKVVSALITIELIECQNSVQNNLYDQFRIHLNKAIQYQLSLFDIIDIKATDIVKKLNFMQSLETTAIWLLKLNKKEDFDLIFQKIVSLTIFSTIEEKFFLFNKLASTCILSETNSNNAEITLLLLAYKYIKEIYDYSFDLNQKEYLNQILALIFKRKADLRMQSKDYTKAIYSLQASLFYCDNFDYKYAELQYLLAKAYMDYCYFKNLNHLDSFDYLHKAILGFENTLNLSSDKDIMEKIKGYLNKIDNDHMFFNFNDIISETTSCALLDLRANQDYSQEKQMKIKQSIKESYLVTAESYFDEKSYKKAFLAYKEALKYHPVSILDLSIEKNILEIASQFVKNKNYFWAIEAFKSILKYDINFSLKKTTYYTLYSTYISYGSELMQKNQLIEAGLIYQDALLFFNLLKEEDFNSKKEELKMLIALCRINVQE